MKKCLLSILLAALLVVSLLPVTAFATTPTYAAGGNGTEADPYQIDSLTQLNALAEAVLGGTDMQGEYFVLTADFTINGEYKPIGTQDKVFSGTFDGKGHTLTLSIGTNEAPLDVSSYPDYGVFGHNKGMIRNLIVKGDMYVSSSNMAISLGGLVGENNGFVQNCASVTNVHCAGDGSQYQSSQIGVLIGDQCIAISNCYSSGTASYSEGRKATDLGACLGNTQAANTNCYYDSTVAGDIPCYGQIVYATLPVPSGLTTEKMQAASGTDGALVDLLNGYTEGEPAAYPDGWLKWKVAAENTYPVFDAPVTVSDWTGLQTAITGATGPTTIKLTANITAPDEATDGITIPTGKDITLDLNGFTLDRGLSGKEAVSGGNVITVQGTLNVIDSSEGKTGKITGGNSSYYFGGGVHVEAGAEFNMDGGSIVGNKVASGVQGGGLSVAKGANVSIENAKIINNAAPGNNGGGIFVYAESSETAASGGGTVTLTNTEVSGNSAAFGGGIFIKCGSVTVDNCQIKNNTAQSGGGGVEIESAESSFTMNGGAITGNIVEDTHNNLHKGAGVHFNLGTFVVKGTVDITGNKCPKNSTQESNVYLRGTTPPTFNVSAMNTGSKIGVYAEAAEKSTPTSPVTITLGGAQEQAACFSSDFDDYCVRYSTDHFELVKVAKVDSITDWATLKSTIEEANGPTTIKLTQNLTAPGGASSITIPTGKDITLDLNGYVLNANGGAFSVITVTSGGILTLKDSNPTETHYFTKDTTTGLWTLAVDQETPTEYIVTGGVITGGNNTSYGGSGVTISGGNVTMNGGNIVGNTSASSYGGGVRINDNGSFTMNGGSIVGNTVNNNGGGVYINVGTFTMKGGTISYNRAGNAAGVETSYSGNPTTFKMEGGEISHNVSRNYTYGYGGIWVNSGSSIILGGTAKIIDNVYNGLPGSARNLYLDSGKTISLGTSTDGTDGNQVLKPAEGMSVGVTMASNTGAFTAAGHGTAAQAACFFADNDNYIVKFNNNSTDDVSDDTLALAGKEPWETPAAGEGYTIDYAAEKITVTDGYEISTNNSPFAAADLAENKLDITPGETYYIRKAADASHKASEAVSFTLGTRQAIPVGPELVSKTDTTISINTVIDQSYSIDNGANWTHGSGTYLCFTDLTPGKSYKIISRMNATNDKFASPSSFPALITTESTEQHTAAADPVDISCGKIVSGGSEVVVKDKNGEAIASETLVAVAEKINTVLNNAKVNNFGKTTDDTHIIAATKDNDSSIAAALKATTADQTAKNAVTERGISKYLNVKLVSAEVNAGTEVTVTAMTFDVTPMATITVTGTGNASVTLTTKITNDEIDKNVTFLLPVDNTNTASTAAVYHEDEFLGNFDVENDGNSNKYIEVTTKSFSEFGYITLDEKTAGAKIGTTLYASLSDAVSKVANDQTITLLKNASGTITVSRAVKFTVDANGKTNNATIAAGSGYTVSKSDSTYTVSAYSGGGGGASSYAIDLPTNVKNGKVEVSPKNASAGQTVTLTVTPDKGFTLETLTVLDKNGKEVEVKSLGNNKYSFKMPSGKVSISATFMEDNTMLNFFVDVKATSYYYDAVLWAAENGITKGTDAVHFSPNAPVTRAQVVTFLWRAAGKPVVNYAMSFVDVSGDAYYTEAVRWAVAEGITKGVDETHFNPNATCTRGQIVSFLYRYAKAAATETSNPFTDVKAGRYYYDAVLWAVENGITAGKTATTFAPAAPCNRAQVVTFLYRYLAK